MENTPIVGLHLGASSQQNFHNVVKNHAQTTYNGPLLAGKEELYQHKNKTFSYTGETASSRFDKANPSSDLQRSRPTKVPSVSKDSLKAEGHFTPQLMMSSQSES